MAASGVSDARRLRQAAGRLAVNRIRFGENPPNDWAGRAGSHTIGHNEVNLCRRDVNERRLERSARGIGSAGDGSGSGSFNAA